MYIIFYIFLTFESLGCCKMENQVFKQGSCYTDVEQRMELNIDFQNLQDKYDFDGKLMFRTTTLLLDNLNTSYEATISILDNGSPNQDSKQITLHISGARYLDIVRNYLIAYGESHEFDMLENSANSSILISLNAVLPEYQAEKLSSVKGDITVSFEPKNSLIKKQSLFNIWNYDRFEDDFKIISAEGIPIGFNRSHLSFISPVFERMLVDGQFLEAENGILKTEFTESTIRAFKRIILEKEIDDEDKNTEMLLFSDKYDIKPLFKICHDHIMIHIGRCIDEERIDLIIGAAYMVSESDGYELLKRVADFVETNRGEFEDTPELKQCMRTEAWAKMMEFIILKK